MKALLFILKGMACSMPLVLEIGCGPIPDYRTLTEVDLHPPEFLGAVAADSRRVLLRFDEEVVALPATVIIEPAVAIAGVEAKGAQLVITLAADQKVGVAYAVEATVEDKGKNSTSIVSSFYGFNPDLPRILINEFITQGSGKHPDIVELVALGGGNTAGMCLYAGTPANWDSRLVLPAITVETGDFLLVHFKPMGVPEEIDETGPKDLSGGYDASPNAYDLWVEGGSGLSGNNGVLSLYSCPGGQIVDAAVYSNRTSASDTDYGGFGSRSVYDRVQELEGTGAWLHEGEHIAPEDAVNPDPSTGTRSMSRDSHSSDTNTKTDWHIAPTGGATFGEVNGDETYAP